jgi:hypothetical protein
MGGGGGGRGGGGGEGLASPMQLPGAGGGGGGSGGGGSGGGGSVPFSGGFVPSVLEELLGSPLPRSSYGTPVMSGAATPTRGAQSGMNTPRGGGGHGGGGGSGYGVGGGYGGGYGASGSQQTQYALQQQQQQQRENYYRQQQQQQHYSQHSQQQQQQQQGQQGGTGGAGPGAGGMANYWPSAAEIVERSRSASTSVSGRGLHSSTCQLNVSALGGTRVTWAVFRQCSRRGWRGCSGV